MLPSEDTDHGTPNSLPQTHTDAGARKWTNADYVELLDYVIESSKISFENAVPGRTRNQAYQAWR
jgi:hypothetical protein